MKLKLDFSNCLEAQDMIKIIERDKGLTATESVEFSINENIYQSIISAGWASIALPLWGHDNPQRKWEKLNDPCIEIELEENKYDLVNKIVTSEDIDLETSVAYFLLFTMDSMGYHI